MVAPKAGKLQCRGIWVKPHEGLSSCQGPCVLVKPAFRLSWCLLKQLQPLELGAAGRQEGKRRDQDRANAARTGKKLIMRTAERLYDSDIFMAGSIRSACDCSFR